MEDSTPGPFGEYLPLFSGATAAELADVRSAPARKSPFRTWRELCRYYGNRCLRCGRRRKLTRDHVIPRAQGGTSDFSNLQPLCEPCNRAKGNRVIDYRPRDREAFARALITTITQRRSR